jgi:hypothetical protein
VAPEPKRAGGGTTILSVRASLRVDEHRASVRFFDNHQYPMTLVVWQKPE